MDLYQHDESFRKHGLRTIAGIDEAGRGPLAGPVVASAVVLPDGLTISGLRDSKKIPERERSVLFWDVLTSSVAVGVGIVDHQEIDTLNILQATKLAMEKAVNDLSLIPDLLILDAITLPSISIKQISLVRADSKSAAVAAASIIAKYVRDTLMIRYHDQYPQYNFKKHKGYCTVEHVNMIRLFGPCNIHRKTFGKVMSLNLPFNSDVGMP